MMTLGGVVVAAGGIALSVRLMAKRNQERKEKERQRRIADGDKLAAARYALDAGNYEAAAVSFLAGERPRDAARAFAKAEMWERAALIYEQLGDWKLAADHYDESGDRAAQIRVLRHGGHLVEAAKVAAQDGEPELGKRSVGLQLAAAQLDALRDVFVQVSNALGYAQERGLVHRDIKPDNIFITGRGEVKLLDFGLARAFDDGFGEQSVLAGTPFYMAHEQIGNDALAEVVFQAMAKKPEARYQTCAELRDAIVAALPGGRG